LAQEALAGLASTEDFSNVTLRKTDESSRSTLSEYLPYSDVMLLHVKGWLHRLPRLHRLLLTYRTELSVYLAFLRIVLQDGCIR